MTENDELSFNKISDRGLLVIHGVYIGNCLKFSDGGPS